MNKRFYRQKIYSKVLVTPKLNHRYRVNYNKQLENKLE